MKNNNFSELTNMAIDTALEAGKILHEGFGTNFKISSKEGRNNLVTEYDLKSEKFIIDKLHTAFPEHNFLAEESGISEFNNNSDEITWVIDPLDGTVNFAHNLPVFSVSIAACRGREILSGVIYQPILDELFVAEKGKGSFMNGSAIHVSSSDKFPAAFLVTGFPYNVNSNPRYCIDSFVDIILEGIPIRRLGSAAMDLAYVACGRFDGFFEINLKPWDVAAGVLLVNEAGGKVTQYDNSKYWITEQSILATNGIIHNDIYNVLKKNYRLNESK